MKKYTRHSIEVVELSVRESLSALPTGFRGMTPTARKTKETDPYKNVTIYKKTSSVKSQA